MDIKKIVIVPTTHWDREWYVPFNEFRAYLVIMMDKLIEILNKDSNFKKFTLDGQTIPLEDYLEVRPENNEILRQLVEKRRLSVGPFYVLPDEFLISGESLIRNLMIGYSIARKFGNVMKAGYIPDPFGHIAQLPQILYGFDIPSVFFMRGFGNEFEDNKLDLEFVWNAPGNSASVLAIHLISGYYSASNLNTKNVDGKYNNAIRQIRRIIRRLERYSGTDTLLLNNGSDHLFAQKEIPEIVKQWNELYPESFMEINDFEYYANLLLAKNPNLKTFTGELRGGRYHPLLSGVFSTRMWIKQENTKIEQLFEKYTEPISTITWILDRYNKFKYPKAYIQTGLKWLFKNHPHDSICGCSIDEVHEEMKTRFQWAEQIGNEIAINSFIYLTDLINMDDQQKDKFALIVYNPLPWNRKDIANFDLITHRDENLEKISSELKLTDYKNNEVEYQIFNITEKPRYRQETNSTYRISFLAEVPACGYKVYHIFPKNNPSKFVKNTDDFNLNENSIENKFYRIEIQNDGQINILEKATNFLFDNILDIEDVGDWGDEYDFSSPGVERFDKKYSIKDASQIEIIPYIDGATQKTLKMKIILNLPISLKEDRSKREDGLIENRFNLFISLYKDINRIDFKINLNNKSKDHRIRILFNTKIKTDKVFADGHFYIVPRSIELPDCKGWVQKALPTNHQKDFICVGNANKWFGVFNKGLPEYEAIKTPDGTIILAITLLRCVGWLSRGDLATRGSIAGPDLYTPNAQCLGKYIYELSLSIKNGKENYLDSRMHVIGKEFNNPFMLFLPKTIKTIVRAKNKLSISPVTIQQLSKNIPVKEVKPYLPKELSFLEIDNKNVMLSALKKAEKGDFLIIRCYNLAPISQNANLRFNERILIKSVEIVSFLEEKPGNEIKAKVKFVKKDIIEVVLEPHVIATIKVDIEIRSFQ